MNWYVNYAYKADLKIPAHGLVHISHALALSQLRKLWQILLVKSV